MRDTVEVPCVMRVYNECEVDPFVCRTLNDGNTAEDKVNILLYENVQYLFSLYIFMLTNSTQVP